MRFILFMVILILLADCFIPYRGERDFRHARLPLLKTYLVTDKDSPYYGFTAQVYVDTFNNLKDTFYVR